MTKIGRNAPCPCGSGKKYKRCCLPKHNATPSSEKVQNIILPMSVVSDDDELDELSNSVVDLVDDNKLDEAEKRLREAL